MSARTRAATPHRAHHRVAHALGTFLVLTGFALAAALVTLAALARTDGDGVSRVAGHPVLTVLSDSMAPTFRAGDLLVDRPATGSASDLAVGDTITFKTGTSGHLITHRIVAVDRTAAGAIAFRTQGDANNAPDAEPVSPEQVVGIYSSRVPYAGYALQAAHSRTGLFLLIVVPLVALLMPLFRTWWRAAEPAGSRATT